jgi:hypothetical protein
MLEAERQGHLADALGPPRSRKKPVFREGAAKASYGSRTPNNSPIAPSLRPPDVGSFQPKLFDPTPHTGTSLSTITSLVPFGIAYIVEEHNLYARFKLSEWRAMHPFHLPRP